MATLDWKNKFIKISVSKMKLWSENPRINSSIEPKSITEYTEVLIDTNDERDDFLLLVKSIAENGFQAYTTVMLWKENGQLYVAEGNRRILAIKLLLKPTLAPDSIKKKIEALSSSMINLDVLKTISVIVAPDFDKAEWHINQQNNISSLKKPWGRKAQIKWIYDTYIFHDKDIKVAMNKCEMTKGKVYQAIRLHKVFQYITDPIVLETIGAELYSKVVSSRFPVTALERFILTNDVQEKWGIVYKEDEVIIKSNYKSFMVAFCEVVKLIAIGELDTRNLNKNEVNKLLERPEFLVSFEKEEVTNREEQINLDGGKDNVETEDGSQQLSLFNNDNSDSHLVDATVINYVSSQPSSSRGSSISLTNKPPKLENDPFRKNLIPKNLKKLTTTNPRLNGLFEELKNLDINKHENCVAACLRVLLDLSVWEYIKSNKISQQVVDSVRPCPGDIHKVTLDQKIEYLSKNLNNTEAKKLQQT